MTQARSKAAWNAPTRVTPRPWVSKPVPWAQVVVGTGSPPATVTPRQKPISFMAICPWSWYIVTVASTSRAPSSLGRARRKMVSAG